LFKLDSKASYFKNENLDSFSVIRLIPLNLKGKLPTGMTTKLNIIFGILSIGLFATLIFKLKDIPGGMIVSGLFLGGMILAGIILGCLIFTGILILIFTRISFLTLLFITTAISFLAFHYVLYSPTLTIKVPNGYSGEINLVLSNVKENILTVDANGIGYINEWTFNKSFTRPTVVQIDGKNLDKSLVGFNPSTFYGKSFGDGNAIKSLSFKVITGNQMEEKHYTLDWMDKVDKKLILLKTPNKVISNKAIEVQVKK
jgi:hypothetical protein